MRRAALLSVAVCALLATSTRAESVVQGDLLIEGRLSVGEKDSSARLNIKGDHRGPPFLVSGVDLTPFLMVSTRGFVGFGRSPRYPLDIGAPGDSLALLLREMPGNPQLAMSRADGSSRRNSIGASFAEADASELAFNILDSDGRGLRSMSLQSTDSIHVHIRPVGIARAELEISDGSRVAGGRLHRHREVSPADFGAMAGASVLSAAAGRTAADELRVIRYARGPRGPIPVYKGAPASVRRPDGFLSLDARISNVELALQELSRRIERLHSEAGGGAK